MTIELILKQLAKIAQIDSSIISPLTIQLAKIAQIDSSILVSLTTQLAKIAQIDSTIISPLTIQLAKIAQIDSTIISPLTIQLAKISNELPLHTKSLLDSLSDGQILSKQWLTNHVQNIDLGNIFLCGGWYAMLLLDKNLIFKKCISFDVDPVCEKISKLIHKELVIANWKFQACTQDIHEVDYDSHTFTVFRSNDTACKITVTPDTIINTSCEHIENFNSWWNKIPTDKLIIVQSNNGFGIPGHVNCSKNLKDFSKKTPMSKVLYSGENEMPKFTRFMRIGYK